MRRPQGFDDGAATRASASRGDADDPRATSSTATRTAGGGTAPRGTGRGSGGRRSGRENRREDGAGSTADGAAEDAGRRDDRADAGAEAGAEPDGRPARSVAAMLRAARRERRRLERREVRRFTRRTRRRRVLVLGSCGAVVAMVLASILVSLSPLMALRMVEVTGTHRLSESTVADAVAGQLGRPLALVDRAAIRRDLGRIRLIRSYSLVSEPPSTLKIRVVERVPLAAVERAGGYAIVDAAGVVIETSAAKPASYPVVSAAVGSPAFRAETAVLASLPEEMVAKVATVGDSGTDGVTFTMRGSTAKVVWGDRSDSDLKSVILTRLMAAVPHASLYDVSSPHDVVTR